MVTSETITKNPKYANLIRWYIKRELGLIEKDFSLKKVLTDVLQQRPEFLIQGIHANMESDIIFAVMEIKKGIIVDGGIFPEILINAFKEYFIEGKTFDLNYTYT